MDIVYLNENEIKNMLAVLHHECQWTGAVMISHIFYSRNPVIIWLRQIWPIAVEKLIGCN